MNSISADMVVGIVEVGVVIAVITLLLTFIIIQWPRMVLKEIELGLPEKVIEVGKTAGDIALTCLW